MLSPICLKKSSYNGLMFLNSITSNMKTKRKTKSMTSYCFIDTSSPFCSPRNKFTHSSFFPKKKIKKSFYSQYPTKNQSIIFTEEKKDIHLNISINKDRDRGKDNNKYPMLNNMSTNSMINQKKRMREKVDLVNFLTEIKRKKYVREKEKVQQCIQSKVSESSKKISLIKSMCDFIYPYILKVKEYRIQNQIDCIKNKGMTIRKEKSFVFPGYIPAKMLYKQKVYHDKIYYLRNKENIIYKNNYLSNS